VVVYYCHGGGFALGSTYFYQEFLMTWVSVLRDHGFKNPAVFALEYTLVPEKTYPHQLEETLAGYAYVLSRTFGSRRVVVSGDSAGGMLVLSMLLHLGSSKEEAQRERPEYAALISPWTHLVSGNNKNTVSDFLDSDRLNGHGRQYAGTKNPEDPTVSPGDCFDMKLWTDSMPRSGMGFYYGSEELFRVNIEILTKRLRAVGRVVCREDESVHAWPVAAMFLESDVRKRRGGLDKISRDIANAVLGKRVRYCKSDSTVHVLHDTSPCG
jgi:acetyl esterase/lipase